MLSQFTYAVSYKKAFERIEINNEAQNYIDNMEQIGQMISWALF